MESYPDSDDSDAGSRPGTFMSTQLQYLWQSFKSYIPHYNEMLYFPAI